MTNGTELAIEMWQAEDEGARGLIQPEPGVLIQWLMTRADTARSKTLRESEWDLLTLRKMLWLRHHPDTSALYGDDGEMQCSVCILDFKRQSVREIELRFQQMSLQKLVARSKEN